MPTTDALAKMDDALAYVLGQPYSLDQKIPVALVSNGGDLDRLAAAVSTHGGTVRHVLHLVSAVAAWVPIRAVEALAELSYVDEIELDQQVHVA